MDTTKEQAIQFFNQYQERFDAGDMNAFASLFTEPFISVRPDGTIQSMPTNDIAAAFFVLVKATWAREGYASFLTKDVEVTPIGAESMLVTLTWVMLDKNEKAIREWRQSDNLLSSNDSWLVMASTFHAQE